MSGRLREFFRDFRGFEADAKKLIAVWTLFAVGDASVWFLLSLYLNEALGYSKVELGTVIFLMSTFSVLPLLPAGYISDRFGRRRMIFLGIFVSVLGMALLIKADSLSEFYLGASIWGLGHSFHMPSFMGFLSEKVGEQRRKYLFSFQMFSGMIASGAAVLVYGFMPASLSRSLNITLQGGYRITLLVGMWFLLAQLSPLLLTKKEDKKEEKSTEIANEAKKLPPMPKLTLVKLCIPMALFGLGAGLIVPFFQVYFQWRFGTRVEDIGVLFAFTQILWAMAYLLMPNIAEKRGSVKAITTVHTFAIMALLAIPVSPNFLFVSAAYITRMVLMNMTWPIFQSYSLSQMPNEHKSFTLSSTSFSFNALRAITPFIAGYLYQQNLELPFLITAVVYAIATLGFYIFFRRKDDKNDV